VTSVFARSFGALRVNASTAFGENLMCNKLTGWALAPIVVFLLSDTAVADIYKRHHDYVLGTSLDLSLNAPSVEHADQAEAAILSEIDRLRRVFSTYEEASEIVRLNQTDSLAVSSDLVHVLDQCESYRRETGNALSCRIGGLVDSWTNAELESILPDRPAMRLLAGEIRRADVQINVNERRVRRPAVVQFATDALAKGYILDAALNAAREDAPELSGVLLNIGGDIRVWGDGPQDSVWRVAVTQGSELGDGASVSQRVLQVEGGAVATSGLGSRDHMIDGEAYGHVLSPADGWPVAHTLAATVYAQDALTADALATALLVLDLNSALNLVNHTPGVEAEVVTADNRSHVSAGWDALLSDDISATVPHTTWPEGYNFSIEFGIPRQYVTDYERPYVAVWIADKQRNLVRILMLAGRQDRWMEENYFWHRRFGRKAGSLVDAIAGPTRPPGRYDLVWDGLDDDGEAVPAGEYILHLEAAREHGNHQHESFTFTLSDVAFYHQIEAGNELDRVSIRFGEND
jgi:FAD:protein FMN transferase